MKVLHIPESLRPLLAIGNEFAVLDELPDPDNRHIWEWLTRSQQQELGLPDYYWMSDVTSAFERTQHKPETRGEWLEYAAQQISHIEGLLSNSITITCGYCKTETGKESKLPIAKVGRVRPSPSVKEPAWITYAILDENGDMVPDFNADSMDCPWGTNHGDIGEYPIETYFLQAVLETQVMGQPRSRISLKAIDRFYKTLTSAQIRAILKAGTYVVNPPGSQS